jgi:hypothetical protein
VINIPPEKWVFDGWPWPESPQVVINAWLEGMRQSWLSTPESAALPLGEAHRLLSDEDAAHAIFVALRTMNWARLVNYDGIVVRRLLTEDDLAQIANLDGVVVKSSLPGAFATPPWQEIGLPRDRILEEMRRAVTHRLCDGRLVAKGISPDDPIRGRPFKIPADRLPGLTLDFRESTASFDGRLVAIGITIEEAASTKVKASPSSRPVSQSGLEAWFKAFKAEWDSRGAIPSEETIIEAAGGEFGEGRVTRAPLRKVRTKLASDWPKKRGPKGPRNSAK